MVIISGVIQIVRLAIDRIMLSVDYQALNNVAVLADQPLIFFLFYFYFHFLFSKNPPFFFFWIDAKNQHTPALDVDLMR